MSDCEKKERGGGYYMQAATEKRMKLWVRGGGPDADISSAEMARWVRDQWQDGANSEVRLTAELGKSFTGRSDRLRSSSRIQKNAANNLT